MNKRNNSNTNKLLLTLTIAYQIGFLVVGPIVVCLLIGLWLDSVFHTSPFLLILGAVIGFSGGMYSAYKMTKLLQ